MTDKVKYTVTIEVEADAIGPAQAIRQALDWARDTESGEGIVTVRASDLSPLRAAVADGRVSKLFTGPVGPTYQAGLPKAVADTAGRMQEQARGEAKKPFASGLPSRKLAQSLYDYGSELMRLLDEDDLLPGPTCQKPAGVDVRDLEPVLKDAAGLVADLCAASNTIKRTGDTPGARDTAELLAGYARRVTRLGRKLEVLTNDQ